MSNQKKGTVFSNTVVETARGVLRQAVDESRNMYSSIITSALGDLASLIEPTPAQITEVIGLIDGQTEVVRRYHKVCAIERAQIEAPQRDELDTDDCNDGPEADTRQFKVGCYWRYSQRVRAMLASASSILSNQTPPGVGLTDTIPVPWKGDGEGRPAAHRH